MFAQIEYRMPPTPTFCDVTSLETRNMKNLVDLLCTPNLFHEIVLDCQSVSCVEDVY